VEKQIERKEKRGRRRQRRKRYRVPVVAVIAVCFVLIALSSMISRRIDDRIKEKELLLSETRYKTEMQQVHLQKLKDQLQRAESDAYIANIARTEYGYIAPGEIRFVITNPSVLWGEEGPPEEFKNK